MRNPNGFGSVYNLTKKNKDKDKDKTKKQPKRRRPWIAVKSVWVEGRRKRVIVGYYKDKPEAWQALSQYNNNPMPRIVLSLKKLYEEWSETKYKFISNDTKDNYKAAWRELSIHENIPVQELRTNHFQSIINKYCSEDGKPTASLSKLKKIKLLACMLMEYAKQNDIVNKNYAEYVELPNEEKEERNSYSDDEVEKMKKSDNLAWVDTVLILIYTGLRINEMLLIEPDDVNIEKQYLVAGLKTEAGKNRMIPIHPCIVKYIQTWLDKKGKYLICNEDGDRMPERRYRDKCYFPAIEAVGVRKLYPHECRHTCASIMAKAGVDTLLIQRILGHKSYSTTADIYTHVDIEQLRNAIQKC